MIDMEKVIRGLECMGFRPNDGICRDCTYFRPFTDDPECGWCDKAVIADDAIALLKELEPVKPIKKLGIVEPYKCGACGWVIGWESSFPLFCPKCGKKVDWDS